MTRAFLDCPVLLYAAHGRPEHVSEESRKEGEDLQKFLWNNPVEASELALSEFECSLWRIMAAALRALDGNQFNPTSFRRQLAHNFVWNFEALLPIATSMFRYLEFRARAEAIRPSPKRWLEAQLALLTESVALRFRARPSKFRFSCPRDLHPRGAAARRPPAKATELKSLEGLLESIGNDDFRQALKAFHKLNEQRALDAAPPEHRRIFEGIWPTVQEAAEVVSQCAEAVADALIFFECEPNSQICSDDVAFAALAMANTKLKGKVRFRRWRRHRELIEERAMVEVCGVEHEAVLLRDEAGGGRLKSDRPLAVDGEEVSIFTKDLGLRQALICWCRELEYGSHYEYGVTLNS